MASSLVNLKKDVQCSLCNDTLIEPKILTCFHTFCKPCIKRHTELIEEVNVFKCPQCKSLTPLPDLNSVEDLKPSLLHSRILEILDFIERKKSCSVCTSHSTATHCFDCDRSLCDECLKQHSAFMKNHKVMSLTDSDSTGKIIELLLSKENCVSHLEKSLDLYCKDCKQGICLECWRDEHDGHLTVSLEKFLSTKRSALSKYVKQLKLQEKQIEDQVKVLNERASKIKDNCDKAKAEVKETLKRTIKKLEQNAQEILSQIDREIEDSNLKKTKGQSTLQQARGAIDYANNLLKKGVTSELIGNEGDTGIYDTSFESLNVEHDHNLVMFDPNKELIKQVSLGLGSIRKVDQTAYDAHLLSSVGVESEKPGLPLVPQQKLVNVKTFNMKGINIDKEKPCFTGIAVNRENTRIAIADSSNYYVFVFNMIGNLLLRYDHRSSIHGKLSDPQGLAFLNEKDLVIAHWHENKICIVNTTTGTLEKTIGKKGNRNAEFLNPRHVHVDSDNIIVSDRGNNRVQVFTKKWKFQYQFGQAENIHPNGTISHNGRYYVSDSYNNVVHVFAMTSKGRAGDFKPIRVSVIDGKDCANGPLRGPCGLAIDSEENLLVCDCGNNLIRKFTLKGLSLGSLSFDRGCDVAVLKDGRVLVTCHGSGVFMVQDM